VTDTQPFAIKLVKYSDLILTIVSINLRLI